MNCLTDSHRILSDLVSGDGCGDLYSGGNIDLRVNLRFRLRHTLKGRLKETQGRLKVRGKLKLRGNPLERLRVKRD